MTQETLMGIPWYMRWSDIADKSYNYNVEDIIAKRFLSEFLVYNYDNSLEGYLDNIDKRLRKRRWSEVITHHPDTVGIRIKDVMEVLSHIDPFIFVLT